MKRKINIILLSVITMLTFYIAFVKQAEENKIKSGNAAPISVTNISQEKSNATINQGASSTFKTQETQKDKSAKSTNATKKDKATSKSDKGITKSGQTTTSSKQTTAKTQTAKKATTIINTTTRWAGKSTHSQTVRTIPYIQNGEQKSITVTVVTGFENEMLAYLNRERANLGRSQLSINNELSELAIIRATEAGVSWSHTRPDGTNCFTVLDLKPELKKRIVYAGENLAWNQSTVIDVMTDWMNSSGHRANIIRDEYNCVGLALVMVEREDGISEPLWAQLFAKIS